MLSRYTFCLDLSCSLIRNIGFLFNADTESPGATECVNAAYTLSQGGRGRNGRYAARARNSERCTLDILPRYSHCTALLIYEAIRIIWQKGIGAIVVSLEKKLEELHRRGEVRLRVVTGQYEAYREMPRNFRRLSAYIRSAMYLRNIDGHDRASAKRIPASPTNQKSISIHFLNINRIDSCGSIVKFTIIPLIK